MGNRDFKYQKSRSKKLSDFFEVGELKWQKMARIPTIRWE